MATLVAAAVPSFRAVPEEGPGQSSRPMDRVVEAPPVVAAQEPLAGVAADSPAGAEDTRVAAEECLRVAGSPRAAVVPAAAGITSNLPR